MMKKSKVCGASPCMAKPAKVKAGKGSMKKGKKRDKDMDYD